MKFKYHFVVQAIIFIIIGFTLGLTNAFVIMLFHFIPSIDFIMKKINLKPGLHRKLFHNIFVIVVSSGIAFYFFNFPISVLAIANLILHILMDLRGKGVELFFPISNYRVKI